MGEIELEWGVIFHLQWILCCETPLVFSTKDMPSVFEWSAFACYVLCSWSYDKITIFCSYTFNTLFFPLSTRLFNGTHSVQCLLIAVLYTYTCFSIDNTLNRTDDVACVKGQSGTFTCIISLPHAIEYLNGIVQNQLIDLYDLFYFISLLLIRIKSHIINRIYICFTFQASIAGHAKRMLSISDTGCWSFELKVDGVSYGVKNALE